MKLTMYKIKGNTIISTYEQVFKDIDEVGKRIHELSSIYFNWQVEFPDGEVCRNFIPGDLK